jgi:uncharacterized protein YjbJ (UPF0337 family)
VTDEATWQPHGYRQKNAHEAEAVNGVAKKIVGRVTGNRRLPAEGRGVAAINEWR